EGRDGAAPGRRAPRSWPGERSAAGGRRHRPRARPGGGRRGRGLPARAGPAPARDVAEPAVGAPRGTPRPRLAGRAGGGTGRAASGRRVRRDRRGRL
ncbi:MAG: hypothetical protein AVDCRST_MAG79-2770, partial [uncultured Thermoleophilia bacterium]